MFGKLKEKLKNWTKSLSKTAKEESEEAQEEEEILDLETTSKKEKSPKKPKLEKTSKKQKKSKKEPKKEILPEIKEEKTETITELLEEPKTEEIIEPPQPKEEPLIAEIPAPEEAIIKEKKSFFSKFTSKINKVTISEKEFWEYAEDLEMLLLENNVAFEIAEKIISKLKERIVDKEFLKKEVEFIINDSLKDIIYELLIEPFDLIEKIKDFKNKSLERKPFVILFCGINGTGKTTTIAKLSYLLKKNNLTSVLAAGDTFRAASIEQLNKHAENLDTKVISHEYGSDPASVGFDAIKYAENNNIDAVLIDTAGRMHTEKNLMAQIEKVAKVTNPNLKIFVGESITGNDIIEQINTFNESVKIDGIILSKADIDEKGGTALSVGATTGKPILYLGTGQNYEDLEPFNRTKFVESLGLGE